MSSEYYTTRAWPAHTVTVTVPEEREAPAGGEPVFVELYGLMRRLAFGESDSRRLPLEEIELLASTADTLAQYLRLSAGAFGRLGASVPWADKLVMFHGTVEHSPDGTPVLTDTMIINRALLAELCGDATAVDGLEEILADTRL